MATSACTGWGQTRALTKSQPYPETTAQSKWLSTIGDELPHLRHALGHQDD
eukprot:CAMPEP_0178371242 /NCGR_PEP_ID=MMETSP0689_2-20121128/724_1 /TAXON_ID=160604 /ORGANISM="Amphidinium massartii, Strain CS-259" /LENGTH=50 /DNA_ID=CAMNT_0019991103 /DNA_START=62 /DNA_END=214 /DNA_ORIENTATION=-